ncbi:uncharacterized protein UV8b_01764 [Ustilaginoidea virens]|uniref:Uncharacterized protein n=1 Tax=Ustilaginoidea virens TaxID=1159556 RepID=A0A8E5MEP5_USTVR|nr:uncharacterized protein UV8b_01764 [Ustilaginoidea virens]QUC17523.1 hypothetical protein UV8b_01764 [Ustilaginoidea virens]
MCWALRVLKTTWLKKVTKTGVRTQASYDNGMLTSTLQYRHDSIGGKSRGLAWGLCFHFLGSLHHISSSMTSRLNEKKSNIF